MSSLKILLQKVGLVNNDNLFILEDNQWEKAIPYRLQKGIKEINPNAFLVQKNKPIAFFFDFSKKGDKDKKLFEKIWNLGGVPIIFIIKNSTIDIYNGFSFDTNNLNFKKIDSVDIEAIENKYSVWDIFSGKSWEKLSPPKNKIDDELLSNLQKTKELLVQNGLQNNYAQNIIGRLLFSRYLIDREVKVDKKFFNNKNSFLKIITDKNLLYKYFEYLKKTFNGDLFPVSTEEKNQINAEHLKLLFHLFNGDRISNDKAIQRSLFDIYNFKIIPIELISEVYERFMGAEKQRKEGAYYTPSFLVDYILEKTVKKHLEKNNICKVFDPSCGSGIFLVEALRHIIEKNLKNKKINQNELKDIVKNNIFGVDKDENAINLSIFSLCLTLLDYVEPKNIAKFKFPVLKEKNLFVADFFNLEHSFNKEIKNLNFIIGNPPWGSDKEKNNLHIQYFKDKKIPVSDKQIAQSFTIRVKDFSAKNTKCAFVLTSKILYNHTAKDFRQYWLKNFLINEILELSPVRSQLFARATAPTAIIFYQYAHKKNTENNIIIHESIKPNIFLKYLKLLVIEKNDIKEVKQEYFQKYDWLWKVMLYGNALDFSLVKRLKEHSDNVESWLNKFETTFGAGFITAKKNTKKRNILKNEVFLSGDDFKISEFLKQNFNLKKISEKYQDLLFKDQGVLKTYKAPHLLLKRSLKDKPIFTFLEKDCAFPNTIFGIHGKDKEFLKSIGAYFSSSLAKYLLFLTSTTWGVEREEILQKEYKTLPFIFNEDIKDKLSKLFDDLLDVAKKQYSLKKILDNTDYRKLIELKTKEIDSFLSKKFDLSKLDKNLIDYNINISVPLFFGEEKPILKCSTDQLKKYAQVFLNHFGSHWNGKPDFFEIDIYFNNYIVGMNFKIVENKREQAVKIINGPKQTKELFKLIKLGEEKITNKLFRQRDVRGFNENSFYIMKPNQLKNWHSAIAQADLYEFIEAITKNGMQNNSN